MNSNVHFKHTKKNYLMHLLLSSAGRRFSTILYNFRKKAQSYFFWLYACNAIVGSLVNTLSVYTYLRVES